MKDKLTAEEDDAGPLREFGKADLPSIADLELDARRLHEKQQARLRREQPQSTEDKLIDLVIYLTRELVEARRQK